MNSFVDDAISLLEKSNADLSPELLSAEDARAALVAYSRAEKLAAYGRTVLARRVRDAEVVARATGTSMGKAKATLQAAEALADADTTREAFKSGRLSPDQASEIARAEVVAPGVADQLLKSAETESFQVLREKARRTVLETAHHQDLGERQRKARSARVFVDELGMVNIPLRLQPHVGTPLAKRAETEAKRRYRAAKREGDPEPFEAYLADAFAAMLGGNSIKPNSKRPELVVLVSHGVAQRGWKDVKPGEHCKIPGVGPVPPEVARDIAKDAFLNGVFFDGTDLRHLRRWSRNIPVDVQIALELGGPPDFDGVTCSSCGARYNPERDHVEPVAAGGATALDNLDWECWPCHRAKTARDRAAGKLKPRAGPL